MMEFYEAYQEYHKLVDFTSLAPGGARSAGHRGLRVPGPRARPLKPFDRLTMVEAIIKYHPKYTREQLNDADWLRQKLKSMRRTQARRASAPCSS